jgi:hypothetical protein
MLLKEVFDTVEIAWNILGKNIKICELGDQRMKWHPDAIAKTFLINNGAIEHISIDVNGRNGSLPLDLSKDLTITKPEWKKHFDLVTNYGTAEHVQNGIYECFKNIHNFCRVGGIMVNDGPPLGCCPWHSPYHYRTHFFPELAKKCGYKTLLFDARIVPGRRGCKEAKDRTLVIAMFQKIKDDEFISEVEFDFINGIEGGEYSPKIQE